MIIGTSSKDDNEIVISSGDENSNFYNNSGGNGFAKMETTDEISAIEVASCSSNNEDEVGRYGFNTKLKYWSKLIELITSKWRRLSLNIIFVLHLFKISVNIKNKIHIFLLTYNTHLFLLLSKQY